MERQPENMQIIQNIMSLAQNLGMDVVAEGTEFESHIEVLRLLGCNFGQGYLFSQTVDAAKVPLLLQGPVPTREARRRRRTETTAA